MCVRGRMDGRAWKCGITKSKIWKEVELMDERTVGWMTVEAERREV